MALLEFGQGLYASYAALESYDQNKVYYCTDTHQMFVGANEYTKGTKILTAEPTEATAGDTDRLYAYNGNLWLCSGAGETAGTYVWTRVANVNDQSGTITSILIGEGLETASGSTTITTTDTIQHAVPSGASTYTDSLSDQTPAFGSTFAITGVSTDKFGHVTAVNEHTVTVPSETVLAVTPASGTAETLAYGSTFSAITGVEKGDGSHNLTVTSTVFTVPASDDTTYSISSTSEGVITLTDSNANASTVAIDGWDQLAKKSDISAVFKYKGSVATVADLQTVSNPQVGDVYQVVTGPQGSSCEYVCIDPTTNPLTWEELGTTIDLSAYATTAYVESALSWKNF